MIALDTSFLLAAEGWADHRRWSTAGRILSRLRPQHIAVPAQALAEMLSILSNVLGIPPDYTAAIVFRWLAALGSVPISRDDIAQARRLATASGLSVDSTLMIVTAAASGARYLLSEDLPDGVRYRDLTIVNPFTMPINPALAAYIGLEEGAESRPDHVT